jgi:hypothetical protein
MNMAESNIKMSYIDAASKYMHIRTTQRVSPPLLDLAVDGLEGRPTDPCGELPNGVLRTALQRRVRDDRQNRCLFAARLARGEPEY